MQESAQPRHDGRGAPSPATPHLAGRRPARIPAQLGHARRSSGRPEDQGAVMAPRDTTATLTSDRPAGAGTDRSTRGAWLVLVAMTGSLSMIMLDQTVVTVALPSMARDLSLSPTGQQWVVGAYVLALAAFVALGGRLGDILGRVKTFQLGMVV